MPFVDKATTHLITNKIRLKRTMRIFQVIYIKSVCPISTHDDLALLKERELQLPLCAEAHTHTHSEGKAYGTLLFIG